MAMFFCFLGTFFLESKKTLHMDAQLAERKYIALQSARALEFRAAKLYVSFFDFISSKANGGKCFSIVYE